MEKEIHREDISETISGLENMKCLDYEMSSMKCPVYEMFFSMKCPAYFISQHLNYVHSRIKFFNISVL